ncbi:MAG: tRNA uridine(34) 5-carboxymethylaminomethyl modification radical SAM/GNAT enzyme Elp3 [Anaerolineae bacterium]|nr:tRNA uridine(34) 5-carboxymethylaminomethyl modification radical SAM/GNAT enzyme Elp3 [Anaerolineae bacterium]
MPHRPPVNLAEHRAELVALLRAVVAHPEARGRALDKLLRANAGSRLFGRDILIRAYRAFAGTDGLPPFDPAVVERLRMKPVRSSSGVTPVTVLTKPFPCPGECIFCPNDVRMPKSYLADEPGAQRAGQNAFDPYLQAMSRLRAYQNTGHPTGKIELIVLGGTWSFYPEAYQVWFIRRLLDALNDFGAGVDRTAEVWAALEAGSLFHPAQPAPADTVHGLAVGGSHTYNHAVQTIYRDETQRSQLLAAQLEAGQRERSPLDEFATWNELAAVQRLNEDAASRCVGLVVETRPDHIDEDEVRRIRRMGCTKVQIGFQSLNDDVLRLNRRGHTVAATRRAVKLLRQAGFKIHAHWMPNLYGSSPQEDVADYQRLFADPDFRPDELKIYPCSLIESAELMKFYEAGQWRPYAGAELLEVLTACFLMTPEYCRLTRVIRDIPGTDIVAGSKETNFRQRVEAELLRRGQPSADIRAREVRFRAVDAETLALDELRYDTSAGREVFLQFVDSGRAIAGFLRLALPDQTLPPLMPDLAGAAIIREVHVYGQAVELGESGQGRAQHQGLGTRLLERAAELAAAEGYAHLAVISAVGTRSYYRQRGFTDGEWYQVRNLPTGFPAE